MAAQMLPEVPRGLLAMSGWLGLWARSFGFMFGDYQALHPQLSSTSREQILRAHRLKRRVHVWTVNSPEEINQLKEWDVDGIITDDPQMAVRTLGRGG
jgi:glycerophosphoryl diester phosphodiesterase